MCLLGMSFLLDRDPSLCHVGSFILGSSFIEFLCGALTHYRAFAIYSYFQTVTQN